MTTLAGVKEYTAGMTSQMPDLNESSEGMGYATAGCILQRYAEICREFCEHVRAWGYAVFSGREPFDPEVEQAWREGGDVVYRQATWALHCGQIVDEAGGFLEELLGLLAAINDLGCLLQGWVTPALAVSPAIRRWMHPGQAATEAERRRVALLSSESTDRGMNVIC